MKMKTISHLNSKVWYRLLKVIFVIIIILTVGAELKLLKLEWGVKKMDSSQTIVYCTQQDKKTGNYNKATFRGYDSDWVVDSEQIKAIDDSFNYEKYINSDDNVAVLILSYCYGFESYNDAGITKIRTEYNSNNKVGSDIDKYIKIAGGQLNFKEKLFDIKPIYYIYYDYTGLLFKTALILLTLILFEVVRRIFYYIVLGSIKPEK